PCIPLCVVLSIDVLDWPSTFLFFFFPEEDGIRGDLVTGVQTCALPISRSKRPSSPSCHARTRSWACRRSSSTIACSSRGPSPRRDRKSVVGKECRPRWAREYELREDKEIDGVEHERWQRHNAGHQSEEG